MLDDRGSNPDWSDNGTFSVPHFIQIGCGVNPPSYWMGTGALTPEVKPPRREADHPPPSSPEYENAWRYNSIPLIHLHDVALN
jgi:hypothetical protein